MKPYLLLLFAFLLLPAVAFSQNKTSSAIQGVVKDANGKPLPGANVVAIHIPSGTRYGTATRKNGHFTFNNVRPGGPYKIQVTFIGFNPQKKTITDIPLGNTATVNFQLERGNLTLDQIAVTATVNPVFSKSRMGAKVHISQQNLERTPQLSRSLSGYISLTPFSTGSSSFAGVNSKYNVIKVDGSTLHDVFGLSSNGIPGGQAGVSSPISISAIKTINVDLAPFGVTNNNFNGAQINAITKSGTNEFHGEAYFQMRNENWEGRYMLEDGYGRKSNPTKNFTQKFYGISIGGPIVKDKLFFFINAEIKRESTPIGGGLPGSGAGNVFRVDPSKFNKIKDILKGKYNYNPGQFNNYGMSSVSNNNKWLAKLNWNINTQNKLMFRYNHIDSKVGTGISRSEFGYDFSNRRYFLESTQNSFIAELNNSLNNNTSNTLRAGYTRVRFGRDVAAEPFPQVTVDFYDLHGNRNAHDIHVGIDRFSQANALGQDLYQLTDNFIYIAGKHKFTFGTSNHLYHFNNLFVQDKWGTYVFRSSTVYKGNGDVIHYSPIENLKRGDPYEYRLSYLKKGGQPRAIFSALQMGFYAQDEWSATDRFTLTYGLRIDIPFFLQSPTYNSRVEQVFGYDTSNLPGGQILWSPRLGFNWQAINGKYDTQIRGGVGVFSGAPPFVWIANQYSNTGADYARLHAKDGYHTLKNGKDEYINIGGPGFFSPKSNDQPRDPYAFSGTKLSGVQGRTEVDLMSHDFKYPQSLKFDLAIDQQLPWGMTATLEGIYTNDINYITYRNINLDLQGHSIYGRPIYGTVYYNSDFGDASGNPAYIHGKHFNNVILLDNSDKGYRYSIVFELQKQFKSGLSFDVSYMYNRAKTVNNGTSSRAISNWQYTQAFDINHTRLGTAAFERRNNIMTRVSYAFFYGRGSSTILSLVYQGHSGRPLVWLYNGNANGDTNFQNDLVYVPHQMSNHEAIDLGKREVIIASRGPNGEPNRAALNAFINSHPGLDKYRGGPVRRYSGRAPFESFLNLKVSQEVATVDGQSIEFELSIFNLPNLLNYKWGRHNFASFGEVTAWTFQNYVTQDNIAKISSRTGINLTQDDLGKPVIYFNPTDSYRSRRLGVDNIASRWRLQFGIKYNF